MNCAEAEILICEYVDGTLANARRAELEAHFLECPGCGELVQDSQAAVAFMDRSADVEPPQELISHILFDPPWHKQPTGWLSGLFHAALQPKFAMGMALTVLSIAMIMPSVGRLTPGDLRPAMVWGGMEDRVYRMVARTEKFYDNLKFIYQIQTTLREWQQQSQETRTGSGGGDTSPSRTEQRRVPVRTPPEQMPAGKP
jgi:hypothetical protein